MHHMYDKPRAWKTIFEICQGEITVNSNKTRKKEEKIPFLKEHNSVNGKNPPQEVGSAAMQ